MPLVVSAGLPRLARENGKRKVALLSVYFAQFLAVLALAGVLLLCVLAIIQRAPKQTQRPVLQPVVLRQPASRVNRRQVAFDASPLPSRGPPHFNPPNAPRDPDVNDIG